MGERIKSVFGLSVWFAVMLAVALLCSSGIANAGASLSPADAQRTCSFWALQYRDIYILRTQGVPREALEKALDEAIARGQVPEDFRAAFMDAISFVYSIKTDQDPDSFAGWVSQQCYNQKTSVRV
jgi:hypothetical protein